MQEGVEIIVIELFLSGSSGAHFFSIWMVLELSAGWD